MKREITLPSGWEELSSQDLQQLAQLTLVYTSVTDLKIAFTLWLIGAQYKGDRAHIKGMYLTNEQVFQIADQHLSWLIDDDNRLRPQFMGNPLEYTTHVGEGWTEMTYGEYSDIQMWMSLISSNKEIALRSIAQIIYPDNDTVSDIDMILLEWWIISISHTLKEKFQRVFSSGSDRIGPAISPKEIVESQYKMRDHLAGYDITKLNQVKQSKLYDALFTLEFEIERNEAREAETNKHR
ncbi:MAG: hypothetical protein ACRC5A_07955 [Enterobacteriaceae bacterium]